ncbi:MAG TPA: hypothetical protein EYP35_05025 [Desulfobacterales bacterium]|nr:hypothetical protein [Desulfobacterales bacterium]
MKYFVIGAICLIGLFYFCLIQRRKLRYKEIALYLGAGYIKESIFKTGKIAGLRKAKKYTVEPIEVGDRAAETHFRTFFSIECKNKGMLLLIKAGFFEKFPDWECVYKLREKKEEKDFIGKLLHTNYRYNSYGRIVDYTFNDAEKDLIKKLFSNLPTDSTAIFKNISKKLTFPSLIQIERNKISLDIGGLILDKIKIKENIDLLEKLSDKIEEQPA